MDRDTLGEVERRGFHPCSSVFIRGFNLSTAEDGFSRARSGGGLGFLEAAERAEFRVALAQAVARSKGGEGIEVF